jgi:hypothetical protein
VKIRQLVQKLKWNSFVEVAGNSVEIPSAFVPGTDMLIAAKQKWWAN